MNDSSISINVNPHSKKSKAKVARGKHSNHIAQLVQMQAEGIELTPAEKLLLVHFNDLTATQAAPYYLPTVQFIAGKRMVAKEAG